MHYLLLISATVLTGMTSLLTVSSAASDSSVTLRGEFDPVYDAADCVDPKFTASAMVHECSPLQCSMQCVKHSNCQAFTMPASKPAGASVSCYCRLFLFDVCSHRVQLVPNCTSRALVYVKRLPGAQRGSLCPAGYVPGGYGTSYKIFGGAQAANWATARQRCSSDGGLAKFADVLDVEELQQLERLLKASSSGYFVFIGGRQQMVGATAIWVWDRCNVPLGSVPWTTYQPDGGYIVGNGCNSLYSPLPGGLDDTNCDSVLTYVCECLAVF